MSVTAEAPPNSHPVSNQAPMPAETPRPKVRLAGLDAMRGLTIALMLLVNNAAMDTATPTQLLHAPWGGGVTLADLVFPWFLLCAGIAIPFSAASAKARGVTIWLRGLRLLWRAVALVALGVLLQSAAEHRFSPGLGVLGLIGLSTLAAGLVYGLPAAVRALLAVGLLTGYGWALLHVSHSGGGPGFTESRNLVAYLNREVLTPFGAAGLPSVIPTTALVLFGTLTGDVFRNARSAGRKLLALAGGAALLTAAGVAANPVLAYNKTVWTPSYIYLSAGLGIALVGAFYYVVDVVGWSAWTFPLIVFGSNAIAAYAGPILLKSLTLQRIHTSDGKNYQDAAVGWLKGSYGLVDGGWAWTIGYLVVVWLGLLVLHRRRWFLRL